MPLLLSSSTQLLPSDDPSNFQFCGSRAGTSLAEVKLYEETKNAGYVCRHCGISRPTLRKWAKRYKDLGEAGLNNQSKRPINSPNKKVELIEKMGVCFTR